MEEQREEKIEHFHLEATLTLGRMSRRDNNILYLIFGKLQRAGMHSDWHLYYFKKGAPHCVHIQGRIIYN